MLCAHICKHFYSIYLKINHTYICTLPSGSVTKYNFLGILFADTLPEYYFSENGGFQGRQVQHKRSITDIAKHLSTEVHQLQLQGDQVSDLAAWQTVPSEGELTPF